MTSLLSSQWVYQIVSPTGSVIARLIDASSRSLKLALNKPGEASFNYALESLYIMAARLGETPLSLLSPARNVLEVYRGDVKMFAGPILPVTRTLSGVEGNVSAKALGWKWLLSKRYIALDEEVPYSGDMGLIIDIIITYLQAQTYGDMGLIPGTIQTSQVAEGVFSRKNVNELIDDFTSASGGLDFDITPDKVYNVYYPIKGQDKTDSVIFTYPGNISSIEEINDGAKLVNSAFGVGKGWGTQELTAERDNVDSQIAFGIFQDIKSYKDVENATFLGDLIQQDVDELSGIPPTYKIQVNGSGSSPDLSLYNIGDFVKVKVNDPFWKFEQNLRIFEIHIDIDHNDKESIELVVGLI